MSGTVDRLGKKWDHDLRARIRELAYDLAESFGKTAADHPDGVTATWFDETLLVTAHGDSARMIAAFCSAAGIASPDEAPPRPGGPVPEREG